MSELKRTQLYDAHIRAGASMVDFGGWEMPIQYPEKIVAEHLYTRHACSIFDVSHMGRLLVEGPQRVDYLQHVLSSNVASLQLNQAQYCIIPSEDGGAVDDAYVYRFEEDRLLLVVNAANIEKDLQHLQTHLSGYDCTLTNISDACAAIALQGPNSLEILNVLSGGAFAEDLKKNGLQTVQMEGRLVRVAKTGYTGEPLGYELYIDSAEAIWLWDRLIALGAKPAGLGARDTLRLEAGYPLYGHEMGMGPDEQPIPIFAVPLAKFAVNFAAEKGDFIGRSALERQAAALRQIQDGDLEGRKVLPHRIYAITLVDRGVMRGGMSVFRGEEPVGWVTSGTVVPYFPCDAQTEESHPADEVAKRAIGLAYLASDLKTGDTVEVDIRGKRLKAVIVSRHLITNQPPFARPVL